MKITELIEQLNEILLTNGNLDCIVERCYEDGPAVAFKTDDGVRIEAGILLLWK